ncbi:MAG: metal ABC transporter ATP-binding protein [Actinomycetota bacterium]
MPDVIRLDQVTIRYGDAVAVENVTATIPAGASVAIIGSNGSGKSTLLKGIAGIVRPDSGSIDVFDHTISLVLQSTEIDNSVPLSVRDTVTMARYAHLGLFGRLQQQDRDAVDATLSSLDLGHLVDHQIHHLSGGQRQRAFVAQGLAQEADVLLLDEPMTGLDLVSRSLIDAALDQARLAGRTTVVTTHSFTEAEACDLVLLLASRCVAFGPPHEVITEANLREAFGGHVIRVGSTLALDDPHHDREPATHVDVD